MHEPPRPDHDESLGDHLGAPVRAAGAVAATLLLLVVAIVLAVVVLRYGVGWGRIWLQELYVWLAAAASMLAAAATMARDGHVRIDIVYARRGRRYRALVDLLGCILLLAPFLATIIVTALPYVGQSWAIGEASREAGGLPGVFLLKSLILAFAGLLAWQGLLVATRSLRALLAGRT